MVKNLKLLDKALQLLPEVKETVVEPLDIAAFLKPLKIDVSPSSLDIVFSLKTKHKT